MRTVAAFILGVIAGAVLITAGLWATGNLRMLGPGFTLAWNKQPLSPPATLPDPDSMAKLPSPPVPPEGGPITPPPEGDADRVLPPPAAAAAGIPVGTAITANANAPHIAAPLAGLSVSTLPDTFNDARTGHKHE